MPGIRTEPLIALRVRFKTYQSLVRTIEKSSGPFDDCGINARMGEEVLLGHDQGITGGTGLFEAAVRLADQRLKRFSHAGERSGVHGHVRRTTCWNDLAGKREREGSGAVGLEHTS